MNLKTEMVIIDGNVVTDEVVSCKLDINNNMYIIKYKNSRSKPYYYPRSRLIFVENPKVLDLKNYNFYINNKLLKNAKEIYEFEYNNYFYYHVIFENYKYKDYNSDEFKKIHKDSYKVIEYMHKVSKITSLDTEDGKKLLYEQVKKIEINDLDTALANYLKMSHDLTKENNIETLILLLE